MSHIRMSCQEMRETAQDFRRAAEDAQQLNDRVNRRAEQLMTEWDGVAEEAFMQDLQSCRQRTNRVPEIYERTAYALEETANRIEDAEQETAKFTCQC